MANFGQLLIMADAVELQISVNSIKRVDPYVKEILMTATHVALYKFCYLRNEWMRTEIEGALFLYSRNGEPYHSFMVMNRLNTVNQIEPLVKEFDYQTQSPFLLYRNSKNKIYGIWFYNKDECDSITSLLKTLMTSLREQPNEKAEKKENVGILSLLSKAQEDFSKTPVKNETQPQFSSTPRTVPDVTSQSVMDFFAKASGKTAPKPTAIPVGKGDNILQRLMSNPAHSVEHIEKQQRSITPQEQNAIKQKIMPQAGDRRSVPINFPAAVDGKSDSVMNFFRVASPAQHNVVQHAASPLTTFLMHSQSVPPDEPPDVSGTSPLAQFLETPQKPALMPPMMFASSSKNETNYLPNSLNADRFKNVEPLTKNQMLQALNYLLRTDSDFVVKLHEAYVKSFTEMIRNNTIN